MSYEYIPTDTKFCDSSSCDECEDLELLSTNKEHDDTKENLLESADESLLEIETGVPSTNKTVLIPKHDTTKVDIKDYSTRVQALEKDIKDTSYNLEELEKATRTEIKGFVEEFNSKHNNLRNSIDDNRESLFELNDDIDSLITEVEEQVKDINAQIESLPQNNQVIETYTRLNVLEEAIDNLRSELEELSQAGNEELAEKVATFEEQIQAIETELEELPKLVNDYANEVRSLGRRVVDVEQINNSLITRVQNFENTLRDLRTKIQELPTTTTDSEIYERLESLEEGLAELIEDITDLPTTDDIDELYFQVNDITNTLKGSIGNDGLITQVDTIEEQLDIINSRFNDVYIKIRDHNNNLNYLESEVDKLKSSSSTGTVDAITNEELESILV